MSIPNRATGYGSANNAARVFRLAYSQALALPPQWEAYDNAASFPSVGALTTTNNSIFGGTTLNGHISLLYMVATTSASPGINWKPTSAMVGSATKNRMKGQTNYVVDPTTPGAGGTITFNMGIEIPSDAIQSFNMSFDLLNRYTFTGSTPTLTWAFNEGTENSPIWTTFTPSTNGIRHCRAGTQAGGPYLLTIPSSGISDSKEGWVTV